MHSSSYLSPKVQNLLKLATSASNETKETFFVRRESNLFVLNEVEVLQKVSEFLNEGERDDNWYEDVLKVLAPVFLDCLRCFNGLDLSQILDEDMFAWISQKQLFQETLAEFQNGTLSPLESLLTLTPMVERSLANVWSSLEPKRKPPSLMRDLVTEPSLTSLWKCPVVDLFFHLLVGTPKGLNLRNLVWHGFATLDEISPVFPAALIILIFSCSPSMPRSVTHPNSSNSVSLVSKIKCSISVDQSFQNLSALLNNYRSKIDANEESEKPEEILPKSKAKLLHLALQHFEDGKFIKSLYILLPEWECICRIIFTKVNGCPDRLKTAESDSLYTTFEEMLSQHLFGEVPVINQFPVVIGTSHTELLFDLLVLPDGPRLRDKISHGEVDISKENSDIQNQLETCSKILFASLHDLLLPFVDNSNPGNDLILCDYSSIFHPASLLKSELLEVLNQITQIQDDKYWPDVDDLQYKQSMQLTSHCHCLASDGCSEKLKAMISNVIISNGISSSEEDPISSISKRLSMAKVLTLFRPKIEYELMSILRRILKRITLSLERLEDNLLRQKSQWDQQILRSRQRATYCRMLEVVPHILHYFLVILTLVAADLIQINGLNECSWSSSLLKSRKKHLQFCENLSEHVNINKNRWEESSVIISKAIQFFSTSCPTITI